MYWTTETINAELNYRRQQAKDDMRRSRKHRPAADTEESRTDSSNEPRATALSQHKHGRRRSSAHAKKPVNV